MKQDVFDVHTHSIASGHAYSTIDEMARAAAEKGLELLGITEHAPTMPGSCHLFYFQNLHVLSREMYGVKMLFGCELNILNEQGEVDLERRILEKMDVCIASIHPPCYESKSKEQNTNAIINAMKNPFVHIIGHPDDDRAPLDYERIVQAAKEYQVLLEFNNSSISPYTFRKNSKENMIALLKLCKQYQLPIIMGSDAHVASDIGNHQRIIQLLQEHDFPEELVVNSSVENLMNYLRKNQ